MCQLTDFLNKKVNNDALGKVTSVEKVTYAGGNATFENAIKISFELPTIKDGIYQSYNYALCREVSNVLKGLGIITSSVGGGQDVRIKYYSQHSLINENFDKLVVAAKESMQPTAGLSSTG